MRVRTTLREALSDPRLSGKALVGPSWHPWRTILLATMGEPLTSDELVTFQQVTGRLKAPTKRREELSALSVAVAANREPLPCWLPTSLPLSIIETCW